MHDESLEKDLIEVDDRYNVDYDILSEDFLKGIREKLGLGPPLTGSLIIFFWVWFIIEMSLFHASTYFGLQDMWRYIFVLDSQNPVRIWTWFTSIFSHSSLLHLIVNSVVLYSFGRFIERRIGQPLFLLVFFTSALIASFSQMYISIVSGVGITLVGASGGLAGLIGLSCIFAPDLRVYAFFVIPLKMISAVLFFVIISATLIVAEGVGAFGIANTTHIAGLFSGIMYGFALSNLTLEQHIEALENPEEYISYDDSDK